MSEIEQSLAIVIGIDHYANVPPLTSAVNDAKKLAEILENKTTYGYKVLKLLEYRATYQHVSDLIENLKQGKLQIENELVELDKNTRLLFYFAGHGVANNSPEGEEKPEGFLVPQDAELNAENSKLLSMQMLHDALVNTPCRHLLIILDCCFAGSFRWAGLHRNAVSFEPKKVYLERYMRFLEKRAQQVITSAAYNQKALDSIYRFGTRADVGGHSPFAELLFDVLETRVGRNLDISKDKYLVAIAEDGIVTATELYAYLREKLYDRLGQAVERQTPGFCQLRYHEEGEYIFPLPGFEESSLATAKKLSEKLNPYKGLNSFEEKDSELFFGRKALTEELSKAVEARPLTVVLGSSGSGKSSLVKAGLIPCLKSQPKEWQILEPIRPGESPFSALNIALAQENLPPVSIPNESIGQEPPSYADSIAISSKNYPASKLLLVIDQFEELITLCRNDRRREQFLNSIAEALKAHQQLRIVLTLRSDFEPQFRDHQALRERWQKARFVVRAMTRKELREAIEEPAATWVMFFEPPDLVDRLIDEVANMPGELPLLSFALRELYLISLKSGRGDRTITEEDYTKLGGVTQSLSKRAEIVYKTFVEKDPIYERIIRNMMLRMVATGSSDLARRPVTLKELEYPEPADNNKLCEIKRSFLEARLLIPGLDEKQNEFVEPAHDKLLRAWSRIDRWQTERQTDVRQVSRWQLQTWLSQSLGTLNWFKARGKKTSNQENQNPLKVDLVLQRAVTSAANSYQDAIDKGEIRKAKGYLWDGDPRLPQLKQIMDSSDNWLNSIEQKFVKESIQRETHNQRLLTTGISIFILGLSITTGVAEWQRQIAQRQARRAGAGQIAAEAKAALLAAFPQRALLLSVKAINATQTKGEPVVLTAEQVLRDSLAGSGGWGLSGHTDEVSSTYFIEATNSLLTVDKNGTALLWDLSSGQPPFKSTRIDADRGKLIRVSISQLKKTVTLLAVDGSIRIWDISNKQPIGDVFMLEGFDSPDGSESKSCDIILEANRVLQASYNNGRIRSWTWSASASSSTIQQRTINLNKFVDLCQFSSSGDWLFFKTNSKEAGLINLRSRNGSWSVTYLPSLNKEIIGSAFSPNNRWLAVALKNGTTLVWDLSRFQSREADYKMPGTSGSNLVLGFGRNHRWLATGSSEGLVRIWNFEGDSRILEAGATVKLPFKFFQGMGGKLAFSLEDNWLYADDDARAAAVLDLHNGLNAAILHPLHNHPEGSLAGGLSPWAFGSSRRLLATVSDDHFAHLWNLEANKSSLNSILLRGHDAAVTAVSISKDGRWLATGSLDGTARLWDLKHPNLRHQDPNISPTISSWVASPTILAAAPFALIPELPPWNPNGGIDLINFDPDGQWIETRGEDHKHRLTELDSSGQMKTVHLLDTTSKLPFILGSNQMQRRYGVLRLDSPALHRKLVAQLFSDSGKDYKPVDGVYAFSEDQKFIAAPAPDGTVWLWNLETDEVGRVKQLRGLGGSIESLAIGSYARRLFAVNSQLQAMLWSFQSEESSHRFFNLRHVLSKAKEVVIPEAVQNSEGYTTLKKSGLNNSEQWMEEFGIDSDYLSFSASLSRNGEWVILKNQRDGYEYLLDLTSPEEMRAWILPKAWISQPIGQDILVKVFDNHVLIWDLSIGSRAHIPSLIKFDGNIVGMDYCSRSKLFVFGLDDGRIAMVEWDDHRRLRIQSSFQAHDKQVRAVAVSQDGRFIASSGYDNFKPYVKLWQKTKDNGEWTPIILSEYTRPVNTIQFSADGQWLATGTEDNLVLIYSNKIDALTKLSLRVAGRELKEEEQNLSSLSKTK